MTIHIDRQLVFVEVDLAGATYNVVAGGPAWVDTDISGDVTPGAVAVIIAQPAGAGTVGVRTHGSAAANGIGSSAAITYLAKTDGAGHLDLYQHGTVNNAYYVIGYLE